MAEEVVESIVVKLEADYRDFLTQINKAVDEGVKKLKQEEDAAKRAADESRKAFKGFGDFLEGKLIQTITNVGIAMAAAFSAQKIVSFFQNIITSSVAANSAFETFSVQFETLLGSASAAKKRIDELATFGQKTPFELDEVVSADRLLQTFGGTALATGENLRRIGDSAAAVNASFQDVSFWTGRLFSAIQAGKPFGEAAMRLSELGIMAPQVRTKMEELQKSGASGTEIWKVYADMIDTRFKGAMDRLSHTLQGVISNLNDFKSMLLREGGGALFEGLRQDAVEFYEIIDKPLVKSALIDLAKGFGDIADALRESITSPFLDALQNIDPADITRFADGLSTMAERIEQFASTSGLGFDKLLDDSTKLLDNLNAAMLTATQLNLLSEAGKAKAEAEAGALNRLIDEEVGGAIGESLKAFVGIPGFAQLHQELSKVIGDEEAAKYAAEAAAAGQEAYNKVLLKGAQNLEEIDGKYTDLESTGSHTFNQMQEATQKATDDAKELADTGEEIADAFAKAREKVDGLAQSMADAVEKNAEQVEALESDHADKIEDIDQDLADKQAEINKRRNDELTALDEELGKKRLEIGQKTSAALVKLEADTVKRRKEINDKYDEELSKLHTDSDEAESTARKDAQEKEKRETEDHQREMRELQEQYLYDLQGAVTARDARAIVDLRRKNSLEKRSKEESFDTAQEREQEELDKRIEAIRDNEREREKEIKRSRQKDLDDLRDNEAQKRNEILASQAEQMAALATYEEEKRAAIQDSYDEQMTKAQERHDEEIAKENERYAERKTALDEALAARLEAVAKELADEKDITEEGARAILEALNATFGLGGDIDKLMEDFAARRRTTMRVNIEFEQNVGNDQNGSEQDRGTPNERGGMGGPARQQFASGGFVDAPQGVAVNATLHGGEYVMTAAEAMAEKRRLQAAGPQFPGDPKPTSGMTDEPIRIQISGSAPPGVGNSEVDAIAGVLVQALQDAGVNARR